MKSCYVTFEEVASIENLCEAWQEFIRGKQKKKDVQEFMFHLGDELSDLHADLMSDRYAHGNYIHFRINDPKPREIHKAAVRDRLLHHAIHRKLYPYFANLFISDSFSCQKGKGLHRALSRFERLALKTSLNNTRTCWVLKCDIRKFFASVDHRILLGILSRHIEDERLVSLLEQVIRSFEAGVGKGIPLGNLTSQLFANIYLDMLDKFINQSLHIVFYVRYADDFVMLSHDKPELLGILPDLQRFLSDRLALTLHPEKIVMKTLASGLDFLGWVHFPQHRILRTKTKRRLLKRITHRPKNETLQSYLGLLRHGDTFELQERVLNEYWLWSRCYENVAA